MNRKCMATFVCLLVLIGLLTPISAMAGEPDPGWGIKYTPHAPIRIDSDADFPGIATSGNGTVWAPWVIENLEIDGSGEGYCVYIGNTTEHFVVKDCMLHDANGGDGSINRFDASLMMYSVTNGTLHNNTANSSSFGIYLYSNSFDNVITENNASSNTDTGILLDAGSEGNDISNNTASHNDLNGIYIYSGTENNLIDNNVTFNTKYGIYLYSASHNRILNCSVNNNTDTGVHLYLNSDSNNVTLCKLADNGCGLRVHASGSNSIYYNNFAGNTVQGNDDTNANLWDYGYPSGGNFWSDYSGADAMSGSGQSIPGPDGIGDTPYPISGIGGSQDSYPLMTMGDIADNYPPISSVDAVVPYWHNLDILAVTATAYDARGSVVQVEMWYRYEAGAWALFGTDSASPWSWDFDWPSAEGNYSFYSVAEDGSGNSEVAPGALDASAGCEAAAPAVNAGPDAIDNSQFTQNATAADTGSGIFNYTWTMASGLGAVNFGTQWSEDTAVSANPDGTYIIRLNVTDNAGNWAADEFNLIWDATDPAIAVSNIVNDTGIWYNVTDANPGMVYWLSGTTNTTDTAPYFIDTSALTPGWFNYTIWACDLAGNSASHGVTVYIPQAIIANPPIPGITGTTPANRAIGVSTSTTITIHFNRSMDRASVQSAFGVTNITANNTVFTFSWSASNTTLVVAISPRLLPLTTYTVTVDTRAMDANGTHMAQNYSFHFATFMDTDLDGTTDSADLDDDGDGVPDTSDAFPLDPTETIDTDEDGIGNDADPDDDNDGVGDAEDPDPLDPAVPGLEDSEPAGDFLLIILIVACVIVGVIIGYLLMSRKAGKPPAENSSEESEVPEENAENTEELEPISPEESAPEAIPEEKAALESPPPSPDDPRIAKLTEAYESGKISKELYDKNLARFRGQQ